MPALGSAIVLAWHGMVRMKHGYSQRLSWLATSSAPQQQRRPRHAALLCTWQLCKCIRPQRAGPPCRCACFPAPVASCTHACQPGLQWQLWPACASGPHLRVGVVKRSAAWAQPCRRMCQRQIAGARLVWKMPAASTCAVHATCHDRDPARPPRACARACCGSLGGCAL